MNDKKAAMFHQHDGIIAWHCASYILRSFLFLLLQHFGKLRHGHICPQFGHLR